MTSDAETPDSGPERRPGESSSAASPAPEESTSAAPEAVASERTEAPEAGAEPGTSSSDAPTETPPATRTEAVTEGASASATQDAKAAAGAPASEAGREVADERPAASSQEASQRAPQGSSPAERPASPDIGESARAETGSSVSSPARLTPPVAAPAAPARAPIADSTAPGQPTSDSAAADRGADGAATPDESAGGEPRPGLVRRLRGFVWCWLKRILITILVLLVAVLVVVRIALPTAIVKLRDHFGPKLGLAITWDELRMSTILDRVELKGLVVRSSDEAPGSRAAFARLGYLRLDLAFARIVTGKAVVERLTLEGLEADILRDEKGRLVVVEHIIGHVEESFPKDPKSVEAAAGGATSKDEAPERFEPPWLILRKIPVGLLVEAVRVKGLKVHIEDRTLSPSLETTLSLDATIDGLGLPTGRDPATVKLSLAAPPYVKSVELDARAILNELDTAVGWSLEVRQVDLRPLESVLAPIALRRAGEPIDLRLKGRIESRTDLSRGDALAARVVIEDLFFGAGKEATATLERALISLESLSLDRDGLEHLHLSRVEVDGLRARAARTERGAITAAGLELDPARLPKASAKVAAVDKPAKAPEPKAPVAKKTLEQLVDGALRKLDIKLEHLRVRDVDLRFLDQAVEPSIEHKVIARSVRVDDLHLNPTDRGTTTRIAVDVSVPELFSGLVAEATLQPFARRRTLSAQVGLSGVCPRLVDKYLGRFGLSTTLTRGTLSLGVEAGVTLDGDRVVLDADLRRLFYGDGKRELGALDRLTLDKLALDIPTLAIEVGRLKIDGVRGAARRRADGSFLAAGFRFDPKVLAAEQTRRRELEEARRKAAGEVLGGDGDETPAGDAGATPADAGNDTADNARGGPKPSLRLAGLEVRNVELAWADEKLTPPLAETRLEAGLLIEGVALDLARPAEAPEARLRATLGVPGVLRELTIKGTVTPAPEAPELALAIAGAGLTLSRLNPYIAPLGIQSAIADGRFEVALEAGAGLGALPDVEARLKLDELSVKDGETPLLLLREVGLPSLKLDIEGGRPVAVELGRLTVGSVRSAARLSPEALKALGIVVDLKGGTSADSKRAGTADDRRGGKRDEEPDETPDAKPAASPEESAPARIGLGIAKALAAWRKTAGELPALRLAGVELGELAFDFDESLSGEVCRYPLRVAVSVGAVALGPTLPPDDQATPIKVRVKLAGVLRELAIDAGLQAGWSGVALTAGVTGEGLRPTTLKPWLDKAGVVSTLADGLVTLKLEAGATLGTEAITAEVALREVTLKDGRQEWAGLRALQIEGVRIADDVIEVGRVLVDNPRATARRDGRLALLAGGLRLPPADPSAKAGESSGDAGSAEKAGQGKGARGPGGAAADPDAPALPPVPQLPAPIRLKQLEVREVAIAVRDEAAPGGAVDLTLGASVGLSGVVLGAEAPPAKLEVRASVPGVLGSLNIDGTLKTSLEAPSLELGIALAGLTTGPLRSYLPPTLQGRVKDGRVGLRVQAGIGRVDPNSLRAQLSVTKLVYTEPGRERPFARVDRVALRADRLDLKARRFVLSELAVEGIEANARRLADGSIEAMGVAIVPGDPDAKGSSDSDSESAAGDGAEAVDETVRTFQREVQGAARRVRLPYVRVERFRIGVDRLAFDDQANAETPPLEVKAVQIKNERVLEAFGPDPVKLPRLALRVEASVAPIVSRVNVGIKLAVGAIEPELDLDIDVLGIHGDQMVRFIPNSEDLFAKAMTDGRFSTRVELVLRTGRRNPEDFDLSRGLGGELMVTKAHLRDRPGGPVILGLDALEVQLHSITPSFDRIHIRSVEVVKPRLHARLAPEGLHAAGFVVKIPNPWQEMKKPKPEGPAAPSGAGSSGASAPRDDGPPKPIKPEIRVDELTVLGCDIDIRDDTVKPPLHLPISDLELGLSAFTTKALTERHVMRVELMVRGGLCRLKTIKEDSLLPGLGLLTNLTDTLVSSEPEYEKRPLFEELRVVGGLSLMPKPEFSFNVGLEAFEFPAIAGAANEFGVELDRGTMDVRLSASLNQRGDFRTDTTLKFRDLDVSEGLDGPVRRFLKLGAPLNTVVWVLRDQDAVVTLPVDIEIEQGQVSMARVTTLAIAIIGEQVGRALANSPFRVLGQVGDIGNAALSFVPGSNLLSFDFGEDIMRTCLVSFEAGESALDAASRAALDDLARRLRENPEVGIVVSHELGGGDMARLERLTSPSREDCQALYQRLIQRKAALSDSRVDLSNRARSQHAAGLIADARVTWSRMRRIDQEIGRVDLQIVEVFELLSPRASRRAARRARSAAIELGRRRLERVRSYLAGQGISDFARRCKLTRVRFSPPQEQDADACIQVKPVPARQS